MDGWSGVEAYPIVRNLDVAGGILQKESHSGWPCLSNHSKLAKIVGAGHPLKVRDFWDARGHMRHYPAGIARKTGVVANLHIARLAVDGKDEALTVAHDIIICKIRCMNAGCQSFHCLIGGHLTHITQPELLNDDGNELG